MKRTLTFSLQSLEIISYNMSDGFLEYILSTATNNNGMVKIDKDEYDRACSIYKRGLGSIVSKIAQPIAKMIDAVAGTNLKDCNKCKERRIFLNNL